MGTENDQLMKDKSDVELEELIRDNPRATEMHQEAQSTLDLRNQQRLRRPIVAKYVVAGILVITAIISYLRTC